VLDVDRVTDRRAARQRLGLPEDRFVVAVMGGSQGSGVLNASVDALLDRCHDDTGMAIRHAVGDRFLSGARAAMSGADEVLYQPIGYEADMPSVYAAADLLVGRGGASTVHEVAVTGIPSVLVPWAASAEDHQTANVRWLADAGAAILLPESEVDRLGDEVLRLRNAPDARLALSERARSMGEVHRQGSLARLVESVALTYGAS
jgi:UDP-N-acetylglucosamine--N-acetylmuramyl-(pentapeptide) pyrophosphoryl-undecaprenol N-acetylglucosamine transferase